MPNLITACQSIDITNQLIRLPYISTNNTYQRLINNASLSKFQYRQIEAFFVNAGGVCAKATPTNINHMGCTGEKTHQISVKKGRRYHGYIMQMARALPWVIGDVNIAFKNIIRPDTPYKMRHSICHCIDMPRRARHRLGKHTPLLIIDPGRQIPRFAHRG